MKERYDQGLTELHIRLEEAKTRREVTAGNPDRIGKQVTQIIRGELESEVVCKQILNRGDFKPGTSGYKFLKNIVDSVDK